MTWDQAGTVAIISAIVGSAGLFLFAGGRAIERLIQQIKNLGDRLDHYVKCQDKQFEAHDARIRDLET